MQEFWNVLLRIAGLIALVCAVAAAYFVASAYRARREGRSALFDAERQVSNDRMMRNSVAGLAMVALTFLFFGLALIGAGGAPTSEQQATRTPTRTVTPRVGTTPGVLATLVQPTSSLPTVPPPPPRRTRLARWSIRRRRDARVPLSRARRMWEVSNCAKRPMVTLLIRCRWNRRRAFR